MSGVGQQQQQQQHMIPSTSSLSRDTYGNVSPPPTMYDTSTSTTETSWSTSRTTGPLHHQQQYNSEQHHNQNQHHNHLHPLKPHNYNNSNSSTPTNNNNMPTNHRHYNHHTAVSPASSTTRNTTTSGNNVRGNFKSQAALLVSNGNGGPSNSPRHPLAAASSPRGGAKGGEYFSSSNSSTPKSPGRTTAGTAYRSSGVSSSSGQYMNSNITTQSEPGIRQNSPYAYAALKLQQQQQQQQNPNSNSPDRQHNFSASSNGGKPNSTTTPASPSSRNAASAARTAFLARRQQQRKQERQLKQKQQQQQSRDSTADGGCDPINTSYASSTATPRSYMNNSSNIYQSFSNRSSSTMQSHQPNENVEPRNTPPMVSDRVRGHTKTTTTTHAYPDPEPVFMNSDEEEKQQRDQQPLKPFYSPKRGSSSRNAGNAAGDYEDHLDDEEYNLSPPPTPSRIHHHTNTTAAAPASSNRFMSPGSVRRKSGEQQYNRPPHIETTTHHHQPFSSPESRYAKAANAALSAGRHQSETTKATPRPSTTTAVTNHQRHSQRDVPRRSYSDRFNQLRKQAEERAGTENQDGGHHSLHDNHARKETNVSSRYVIASARTSRAERSEEEPRRDRTSTSLPPVRRRRPLQQPAYEPTAHEEGAIPDSSDIFEDLEREAPVISTGSPQRISKIKNQLWNRDGSLQSSNPRLRIERSPSPPHRQRHSTGSTTQPQPAATTSATSGFKSKFYQAAVAAQREGTAVHVEGELASSSRLPSTPPRYHHHHVETEDEIPYNDGPYYHHNHHPRNTTPPRPRSERPVSPVTPGSHSRRSGTPPRSSNGSGGSAFHEHRSPTPPRPMAANNVMPPTPPHRRSRSSSPWKARPGASLMEKDHVQQVPFQPEVHHDSHNNIIGGENHIDSSSPLMSKKSIASLVAKLNAVSRDDPHAALAQIDHILKSQSTDELHRPQQHGHHQQQHALQQPQPPPPSPHHTQHASGNGKQHQHYHHHHHHHRHQSNPAHAQNENHHEEGDEEESSEGSSDEETSVSEITDPTYMDSKPTHEQLHDMPPPKGLSTATFRRPRPSALQGYNTPSATHNQAVAGLDLVQRHHQRKSTKKSRAIAAHIHAQANAQARANTPVPSQKGPQNGSETINVSSNHSSNKEIPPKAKPGTPTHSQEQELEAQKEELRKEKLRLYHQEQELKAQQELLLKEKLRIEQQERAEKASLEEQQQRQMRPPQNDQVDEEMQQSQNPNQEQNSRSGINTAGSHASGAAATHTSSASNGRAHNVSREQQKSRQEYEVINTNNSEKIIQPTQSSKSNNPFDDTIESIEFGNDHQGDASANPKERKLDKFMQKKHEEQLLKEEQTPKTGEDTASKIKRWDELSSPPSVSKSTSRDDRGTTVSVASVCASANAGPEAFQTAATSVNSSTQSVQSKSSRRSHPWDTNPEATPAKYKVDTRDTSMDIGVGVEAMFFQAGNPSPAARQMQKKRGDDQQPLQLVDEDRAQDNWDTKNTSFISKADSKTAVSRESGERTAQESLSYAALDTSMDSSTQVIPRVMPVVPLAQQQEANFSPDAFLPVDTALLGKGYEVTPLFGAGAAVVNTAATSTTTATTHTSKQMPPLIDPMIDQAPKSCWVDIPSSTFRKSMKKSTSARTLTSTSNEHVIATSTENDTAVSNQNNDVAAPKVVATLVDDSNYGAVTMVRSPSMGAPSSSGMPPTGSAAAEIALAQNPSIPNVVTDAFADIPYGDTDLTENSQKPLLMSTKPNNNNVGGYSSNQVDGTHHLPLSEARGRRGFSNFLLKRARGRKKSGASPSPRQDSAAVVRGGGNNTGITMPRGRRLTSKSPARDRARSRDRRAPSQDRRGRSQSVENNNNIRNPKIAKKFSRLLKVYGNDANDEERGYF